MPWILGLAVLGGIALAMSGRKPRRHRTPVPVEIITDVPTHHFPGVSPEEVEERESEELEQRMVDVEREVRSHAESVSPQVRVRVVEAWRRLLEHGRDFVSDDDWEYLALYAEALGDDDSAASYRSRIGLGNNPIDVDRRGPGRD